MLRACQFLVLSALLVFFLVPTSHAAEGRVAYLVRDVADGEVLKQRWLSGQFLPLGDRIIFPVHDDLAGVELWVSDGTPHGTELLVDACLGSCSSDLTIFGSHRSRLYWLSSAEGSTAWRLWTSDGTRAGTRALTHPSQIIPHGSRNGAFVFAGSFLYFSAFVASDLPTDFGLWRTDGATVTRIQDTTEPFRQVFDLASVGDRVLVSSEDAQGRYGLWVSDAEQGGTVRIATFTSSSFGFPHHMAAAGNRIFFVVDAGEGDELWSSDGTAAGTGAVTRFAPAKPFPTVSNFLEEDWLLRPAGNLVYFIANDVVHEDELWRSDGTMAGTFPVTDIDYHDPFGEDRRSPGRFHAVGDRFLFQASDGLTEKRWWVSNGTRETARPLQDECPSCQLPYLASDMFPGDGRVIFAGSLPSESGKVWTSDGTALGTQPISACVGPCGSLSASSGGAFFLALDEVSGHQGLWFSDGTPVGTKRLADIGSGVVGLRWGSVARTGGGRFFFSVSESFENELQLWVSHGTPASSHPVEPVRRQADSSSPRGLVAQGERLFFVACTPGDGLWRTGGSAESTTAAVIGSSDTRSCNDFSSPVQAGGSLFFFRADVLLLELWKTDGTAAGTVNTALPSGLRVQTESAFAFAGQLHFHVEAESGHSEVWRSDGTLQGTVKAFELPDRGLESLSVLGNELYFFIPFDGGGFWRSDGTQAGTREIAPADISDRDSVSFVRFHSQVYFQSSSRGDQPEIWKTDGTPSGTGPVVTLPLQSDTVPWNLTVHDGSLFFFAEQDRRHGLWRSDGTQAGTVLLRDFDGRKPFAGNQLTPFGDALYFVAADGEHGTELWRSDGTAAGTVLLRDILPGVAGSLPSSLVAAGDRLFFVATELAHGTELWQTDGTQAGTRLAHDIAPLARPSSPTGLTVAGDRLYFAADDGLTGRELWAFPLSAPGCQPGPAHLCLGRGRFKVEVVWHDFQGNTGTGKAVPLTADTGYFWFFDPANVETIVKVLDGQGLNGHHWVFYGALSSVEYVLTVTDLQTGLTRRYLNPSGVFASIGDTQGFGPLGAFSRDPSEVVSSSEPDVLTEDRVDPTAATGSCQAGPQRLCLQGGRFGVEVSWKDFQNRTGAGKAVPLTSDTGYFWFFDAANVEVVTKVLDGTALNGKLWFFYGALSNVEYRITVTDTVTGTVKTYSNPSGRFASVGDTGAF